MDTVVIKNALYDPTTNYCFFVNSDKPKANALVEAYDCVKGVSVGTNQELFVMYNDNSIRHVPSNLCVAFNGAQEIVLTNCANPAVYKLFFRSDGSLYFYGYDTQSVYIDDSQKTSANYVTSQTTIIVTTQADAQTFKKENIKSKQFYNF